MGISRQVRLPSYNPPFAFPILTLSDQISEDMKFIIKNVPPPQFTYIQDIYRKISSSRYLRVARDAVPERSMFVYDYASGQLLNFAQKDLSLLNKKRILRDVLRGLADLHEQGIVHTGKASFSKLQKAFWRG